MDRDSSNGTMVFIKEPVPLRYLTPMRIRMGRATLHLLAKRSWTAALRNAISTTWQGLTLTSSTNHTQLHGTDGSSHHGGHGHDHGNSNDADGNNHSNRSAIAAAVAGADSALQQQLAEQQAATVAAVDETVPPAADNGNLDSGTGSPQQQPLSPPSSSSRNPSFSLVGRGSSLMKLRHSSHDLNSRLTTPSLDELQQIMTATMEPIASSSSPPCNNSNNHSDNSSKNKGPRISYQMALASSMAANVPSSPNSGTGTNAAGPAMVPFATFSPTGEPLGLNFATVNGNSNSPRLADEPAAVTAAEGSAHSPTRGPSPQGNRSQQASYLAPTIVHTAGSGDHADPVSPAAVGVSDFGATDVPPSQAFASPR